MRIITVTACLLSLCHYANSQRNGVYHSLTVITGDYTNTDASIGSELDGKRAGISYDVMKKSRGRKTTLQLGWQGGSITGGDDEYQLNEISLQWSDGFKIGVNRFGNFNAYVGYSIHLNPSFARATGKSNEHYTWNTVNTLGLYQSYQYNWRRQSVSLDMQLPVIGAASRPGMLTVYPEDMNGLLYDSYSQLELISWDNYKDIALKLAYHRELTTRWQLNAGLHYRYTELETSLPVKSRSVSVQAGVAFKVR